MSDPGPASAPPPDAAERIARLAQRLDGLFLAGAGVAAAVALGQLARGRTGLVSIGAPLAIAAAALAARWLPAAVRVGAVVVLLPGIALTFLANGVAAYFEGSRASLDDPRPLAVAVRDWREAGHPEAVPPSKAWAYLTEPLDVDGVATVPLAGVGNALEVLCNEAGPWRAFGTDRMGFTNPDAVWDAPAELVLIGDSFTQGFCVDEADSFAGRIRAAHPATVNLGGGANGPLVELGTLVEFQPRARGRLVLWFFFEANDLDNLIEEERQPILRAYLERGRSQHLLDRLPAIHAAQRANSERRMSEWFQREAAPAAGAWDRVLGFVKLGPLRRRLGMLRTVPHPYDTIDAAAVEALFPRVAQRIAEEAAARGARVVLVYLPGREAFAGRGHHPLRPVVLEAARAAGIEVLDMTPALARDGDAAHYYVTSRHWSHFTPEGHRIVADAVLQEIERRGWLSPPR